MILSGQFIEFTYIDPWTSLTLSLMHLEVTLNPCRIGNGLFPGVCEPCRKIKIFLSLLL